MIKNKTPQIIKAFDADPVGTLVNMLWEPLEALIDLQVLREHVGYEVLVDHLTKALKDPTLKDRYSSDEWLYEAEGLPYMPGSVTALLIMPSMLSGQLDLFKTCINPAVLNGYVPTDPMEVLDFYIARDNSDEYRTSDVMFNKPAMIPRYIDRLKLCGEAFRASFSDGVEGLGVYSSWYQKARQGKLRNTTVCRHVAAFMLAEGPGGPNDWLYPSALGKVTSLDFNVKSTGFLHYLDAFLSSKAKEAFNAPEQAENLNKVYTHLLTRRNMDMDKEGDAWWMTEGIQEFHRLFMRAENGWVQAIRADPKVYSVTAGMVFNLLDKKLDARHLGFVAEFVSAWAGNDETFRARSATMKDSLAQLAHLPFDLIANPGRVYGKIKEHMVPLFKGADGEKKVLAALDETTTSRQANFYGSLFPELLERSRNPWIKDQRMAVDLGL